MVEEAVERTEIWIEDRSAQEKQGEGFNRYERWLGKKLRGLKDAAKSKWTKLWSKEQANPQATTESAARGKQAETPEKK